MEIKTRVDEILETYNYKVENLLPLVLDIQKICEHKFIDSELSAYIADAIGIPYSQMSEVLTFFAAVNQEPKGKYHIEMCNSTVCRVNENDKIETCLKEILGIEMGETTEDRMFSMDYAPCFGACDVSPSIRINKKAYGHLTVEKVKQLINELRGD